MRTFREYTEFQTQRAQPRWAYVAHLAQTMTVPEIAKILGVSRQRVYQIVKKAKEKANASDALDGLGCS